MQEIKVKLDQAPMISLLKIEALLWAFAHYNIPDKEDWNRFYGLFDKEFAQLVIDLAELNPDKFDDADSTIEEFRQRLEKYK